MSDERLQDLGHSGSDDHDGHTIAASTGGHRGFGCPGCGFDLYDLLVHHPCGLAGGVARAITVGLPCCGYYPSNEESKRWARAAALMRRVGS
jgi:hypothetical protein